MTEATGAHDILPTCEEAPERTERAATRAPCNGGAHDPIRRQAWLDAYQEESLLALYLPGRSCSRSKVHANQRDRKTNSAKRPSTTSSGGSSFRTSYRPQPAHPSHL